MQQLYVISWNAEESHKNINFNHLIYVFLWSMAINIDFLDPVELFPTDYCRFW